MTPDGPDHPAFSLARHAGPEKRCPQRVILLSSQVRYLTIGRHCSATGSTPTLFSSVLVLSPQAMKQPQRWVVRT